MNLFHLPDLDTELVELPEEEAHHAVHVLRMKAGDLIGLLDGRGTKAEAELVEVSKRRVLARISARRKDGPERSSRIHLAVAPTKQMDRYEWFVEKAVEIGVDRITPLLTERSERNKVRIDRLHKVMVAAMKQSQRTWLPLLDEATPLKVLLQMEMPSQRFFGWCEGQHRSLMDAYTTEGDTIVLIGPEGDFSSGEAAMLEATGFEAIGIGEARLRTETAALTACTWMSLAQQR